MAIAKAIKQPWFSGILSKVGYTADFLVTILLVF